MNFLSNQRRKRLGAIIITFVSDGLLGLAPKEPIFSNNIDSVYLYFSRKGDMMISASNYERQSFWSDRLIQSKQLVLFIEVDASPLHTAWSISSCAGVT